MQNEFLKLGHNIYVLYIIIFPLILLFNIYVQLKNKCIYPYLCIELYIFIRAYHTHTHIYAHLIQYW